MPEDQVGQEMARILNEKLQRVIDRQTEHTVALANHTASLDRLEKGQEELKNLLLQVLAAREPKGQL